MWDKIKAWFCHSITMAWAQLVVVCGFLAMAFPDVKTALQHIVEQHGPDWGWPAVLIVFGLITAIARLRSAWPGKRNA